MGSDFSLYRHIVLVLPKRMRVWAGPDCDWTGMGQVGPYATGPSGEYLYGVAWISGDYWNNLGVWMHEIGHNLYLGHAGQVMGLGGRGAAL